MVSKKIISSKYIIILALLALTIFLFVYIKDIGYKKMCQELSEDYINLTIEANYCQMDSDCIETDRPYVCNKHLINKDFPQDEIEKKYLRHYNLCPSAIGICKATSDSFELKCINNKCNRVIAND